MIIDLKIIISPVLFNPHEIFSLCAISEYSTCKTNIKN